MGWKGGVKTSSLPSQKTPPWITDWILTASLSTWKLFLFTYSPQTQKRKEKSDSVFMIVIIREKSKPHHYRSASQPTYICITIVPIVALVAYGLSLSISSLSHLIHLLLFDSLSPFFLSKVLVQLSLVVEFNVRQCFKAIRVFALRDISGRLFLAHSQRRNTQNCLMFYTEAARERRHKVNTCRMSM